MTLRISTSRTRSASVSGVETSPARVFGVHVIRARIGHRRIVVMTCLTLLLAAADTTANLSPHDEIRRGALMAASPDIGAARRALDDAENALKKARHIGASERAVAERAQSAAELVYARRQQSPVSVVDAAKALEKAGGHRARARAAQRDAHLKFRRLDDARALSILLLTEDVASVEARAIEPELDANAALLNDDQWRVRLDGLIAAGRLSRARDDARRLVASTSRTDPKLLLAMARALVRGRVPLEAVRLLDDKGRGPAHLSFRASKDDWLDARAWALGKAERFDDAMTAYDALRTSTTNEKTRRDACFKAGFLAYERDDLVQASARFRRCLDEENAKQSAERSVALRWYMAFVHHLRGANADAIAAVADLVKEFPDDKEARKHRYFHAVWRATSSADANTATNDAKIVDRELKRLVDEDPTDWYGHLARRRLGLAPARGVTLSVDDLVKKRAKDAEARRAQTLFAAGFHAEARAMIRDRTMTFETAALAASVGATHEAWRYGAKFLPFPRVKGAFVPQTTSSLSSSSSTPPQVDARGAHLVPHVGWRVSYATPHLDDVERAAKTFRVPKSFIYAIMRTESGFDPTALSVAGARGLLQLMPHTARGIAQHHELPIPTDDALYDPATMVPLGAATLALFARESGSLLLGAASYNGAPDNVAQWVARYGALDPEIFVERIPFKETRDYVKKVLPTEAIYRSLDGAPLELVMPDKISLATETLTAFAPDES